MNFNIQPLLNNVIGTLIYVHLVMESGLDLLIFPKRLCISHANKMPFVQQSTAITYLKPVYLANLFSNTSTKSQRNRPQSLHLAIPKWPINV